VEDRDRRLMEILRRDARRSIVALARDLNLSRSATQERLAKLRASGAIKGFTIIDSAGEGGRQSAYMSISFDAGFQCAQVVPKLRLVPGITLIHSVAGPIDLVVRVDADSVGEIERCRSNIAAVRGVGSVSTAVVLDKLLG
jgi:Lrp/AsnC family transcriptional regulator, leucine-responsive regulatory protein